MEECSQRFRSQWLESDDSLLYFILISSKLALQMAFKKQIVVSLKPFYPVDAGRLIQKLDFIVSCIFKSFNAGETYLQFEMKLPSGITLLDKF